MADREVRAVSRLQRTIVIGLSVVVVALIVVTIVIVATPRTVDAVDTEHPSPALVVEQYLTALAEGDAEAALAIDSLDAGEAPYLYADRTSFLTNAVLASAVERISDPAAMVTSADDEVATVEGSFTLAGVTHTLAYGLTWDHDAEKWRIDGSLANEFSVYSYIANDADVDTIGATDLAFTLSGTEPEALGGDDTNDDRGYIAYPAVYELVVDIDEGTLADPAAFPVIRSLVLPSYWQNGPVKVGFAVVGEISR